LANPFCTTSLPYVTEDDIDLINNSKNIKLSVNNGVKTGDNVNSA
jgi:hypothetical protein